MVINGFIDGVRYPDETDGLYFDATPYDDVVDFLKNSIAVAEGQLKTDLQYTLYELEQIWEERQSKTRRFEIPARKASKTV